MEMEHNISNVYYFYFFFFLHLEIHKVEEDVKLIYRSRHKIKDASKTNLYNFQLLHVSEQPQKKYKNEFPHKKIKFSINSRINLPQREYI